MFLRAFLSTQLLWVSGELLSDQIVDNLDRHSKVYHLPQTSQEGGKKAALSLVTAGYGLESRPPNSLCLPNRMVSYLVPNRNEADILGILLESVVVKRGHDLDNRSQISLVLCFK